MDLYALHDLVRHYAEPRDRDLKEVRLLTPSGERFDILSLSFDDENDEWVLIGEGADE